MNPETISAGARLTRRRPLGATALAVVSSHAGVGMSVFADEVFAVRL
jgi:hypothetical protein